MKKQSILSTLMLLAAITLTACSSDDSNNELPEKKDPFIGRWGLICNEYYNDTVYYDVPNDTIVFFENGVFYNSEWKNQSPPPPQFQYTFNDSILTLHYLDNYEAYYDYTFSDNATTLSMHYSGSNLYFFHEGDTDIILPNKQIYRKLNDTK